MSNQWAQVLALGLVGGGLLARVGRGLAGNRRRRPHGRRSRGECSLALRPHRRRGCERRVAVELLLLADTLSIATWIPEVARPACGTRPAPASLRCAGGLAEHALLGRTAFARPSDLQRILLPRCAHSVAHAVVAVSAYRWWAVLPRRRRTGGPGKSFRTCTWSESALPQSSSAMTGTSSLSFVYSVSGPYRLDLAERAGFEPALGY